MTTIQHPSSAVACSAIKHALLEAIKVALVAETEIDIDFGLRFPMAYPDAIGVTAVRSSPQPMSPNLKRTRYDDVEIDVSIICQRAGFDQTAEVVASDRAYALLATIDTHLRTGDNIALGGAAVSIELGSHQSAGASEEDDQDSGWRLIEIAATFKALAYIRN